MENGTITISWPFEDESVEPTLKELIPRLKGNGFKYDALICSSFLTWTLEKKYLPKVKEIVKDYPILKLGRKIKKKELTRV